MLKHIFTLSLLSLLYFPVSAQKFHIALGLNAGASFLKHNSDFELTELKNDYNSNAKIIKERYNIDYTWDEYKEDMKLRSSIIRPRFGLNLYITHRDFPIFLNGEFMSSTSSYQKASYAVTLGMGKDIQPVASEYYYSIHGGFKRVFKDDGFGAETIVNSIGDKEQRAYLSTFFDPKNPLNSHAGNLLSVRGGMGKFIGDKKNGAVGAEFYAELDLTNETVRQARMHNFGLNIYFRLRIVKPSGHDNSIFK